MSKKIKSDSFKNTITTFNPEEYNKLMDKVLYDAQNGIIDIYISSIGFKLKYDTEYVNKLVKEYSISEDKINDYIILYAYIGSDVIRKRNNFIKEIKELIKEEDKDAVINNISNLTMLLIKKYPYINEIYTLQSLSKTYFIDELEYTISQLLDSSNIKFNENEKFYFSTLKFTLQNNTTVQENKSVIISVDLTKTDINKLLNVLEKMKKELDKHPSILEI